VVIILPNTIRIDEIAAIPTQISAAKSKTRVIKLKKYQRHK
jgi:hypothetical protein